MARDKQLPVTRLISESVTSVAKWPQSSLRVKLDVHISRMKGDGTNEEEENLT